MTSPPRHKMALLTWAGAWTMITLILWLLGPPMDTWPLPLRTLVVSVLTVLALTWVVIPALTRMFAGWLAPAPAAAATSIATGVRRIGGRSRQRALTSGLD